MSEPINIEKPEFPNAEITSIKSEIEKRIDNVGEQLASTTVQASTSEQLVEVAKNFFNTGKNGAFENAKVLTKGALSVIPGFNLLVRVGKEGSITDQMFSKVVDSLTNSENSNNAEASDTASNNKLSTIAEIANTIVPGAGLTEAQAQIYQNIRADLTAQMLNLSNAGQIIGNSPELANAVNSTKSKIDAMKDGLSGVAAKIFNRSSNQ